MLGGDFFSKAPRLTAWLLLGSWLLTSTLLLGMPWISQIGNKYVMSQSSHYGDLGSSCTLSIYTPGIKCANGDNIIELALAQNRTWLCACQQGLFGDSICPVQFSGFSVSWFISSGPSNGIVWGLGCVQLLAGFWHAEYMELRYNPSPFWKEVGLWTMVIGVAGYCLLNTFSTCLMNHVHVGFSVVMEFGCGVHWVANALIVRIYDGDRKHFCASLLPAVFVWVFVILQNLCGVMSCWLCKWCCTWGYWFFETLSIMIIFGMPVYMVWVVGIPLPMSRETKNRLLEARKSGDGTASAR